MTPEPRPLGDLLAEIEAEKGPLAPWMESARLALHGLTASAMARAASPGTLTAFSSYHCEGGQLSVWVSLDSFGLRHGFTFQGRAIGMDEAINKIAARMLARL